MKLRIKALLLTCLAVGTIGLMTGCSGEKTPYQINDSENYTVSVKYDANGGAFTTNTSIIVDSYNITDMQENSNGQVEIALISPDDDVRDTDAFTAIKSGYFLAGWYAERTETGKDADGNPIYSYGKKWNFEEDLLEVDADGTYTSNEPVLTLYAAWVPLFEIQFYSLETGEYMDSLAFDPNVLTEIQIPEWDEETGAVEMYKFPENSGYTFNGVYLDEDGKKEITTATIEHTGVINYENGTAENGTMKVYVDWLEGEWYHIYNVEQFLENASVSGNYEIHADLDFTDETWPTSFMHGNFEGTINGNGHTFKNIEVVQTNNSKVNTGLFGALTEEANINGLTFENVTLTIEGGTRVAGASYGLFAGTISDQAIITDVKILGSTIQVDSDCYFGVDDYSIGLLCGMGNETIIPDAAITCVATGENPENVKITIDGNTVTVEFIEQ